MESAICLNSQNITPPAGLGKSSKSSWFSRFLARSISAWLWVLHGIRYNSGFHEEPSVARLTRIFFTTLALVV